LACDYAVSAILAISEVFRAFNYRIFEENEESIRSWPWSLRPGGGNVKRLGA
jgi:hypothetical protein